MSEEIKLHLVTAGSECSDMVYYSDHIRIAGKLQAENKLLLEREQAAVLGETKTKEELNKLDGRLYAMEGVITGLEALVTSLEGVRDTQRSEIEYFRKAIQEVRDERAALADENGRLINLLSEAGDELKELKVAVGFRAHTLDVIQRIDTVMNKGVRADG